MRRSNEHAADVSDLCMRLHVWPDHESRRVDQRNQEQTVRVAQLHEAGRFICLVGIDGTAQVLRIAGDQADWTAVDARQCSEDPEAEGGAQLEEPVRVSANLAGDFGERDRFERSVLSCVRGIVGRGRLRVVGELLN